MLRKMIGLLPVSLLVALGTAPAQAEYGEWHGEITPYAWAIGLDGDVTIDGDKTSMSRSFSDLLDATDFAGSVLTVLNYGHVVLWGQYDYTHLNSDNLDNAPPRAELDVQTTIGTLAVGYRFDGRKGRTYDLLIGARMTSIENKLKVSGVGSAKAEHDVTDAVVVFRPSMPLSKRWRFNPTISVGTGDSDLTYEIWPQLQYHFSDNWALRVGYRQLHYKFENGNDELNLAFTGPVVGFGGTW